VLDTRFNRPGSTDVLLLGVVVGSVAGVLVSLASSGRRRDLSATLNRGMEEAARLVVRGRTLLQDGRALLSESRAAIQEGRQVIAQALDDGRRVYHQVKRDTR